MLRQHKVVIPTTKKLIYILVSIFNVIQFVGPKADPDYNMVPHLVAEERLHLPEHLLQGGVQSHVSALHHQQKGVG